jgi:glycyl-tRNA synthetase
LYVYQSQVNIAGNLTNFSPPPAVANGTLTLRERDSTDQLIGKIDDVIAVTVALSNSQMKWAEACEKLEKYSGTQEIE